MVKDQLKLQFVILIWGFTAILGAMVSMASFEIVFFRTLFAAVALGILIFARKFAGLKVPRRQLLALLGTGALIGIHWLLFFGAVKIAGASIGLVGLSTTTLWSALLAPFFLARRISILEVFVALIVVCGLTLISQAEFEHRIGLMLSVGAAAVAAVFAYLNAGYSQKVNHQVIAFYEMVGAFVLCSLYVPLNNLIFAENHLAITMPNTHDVVIMLILSLVCTVYAFAASVELLKRVSVFVVSLCVNLEPVYGILLAAAMLGEHHRLTQQFYIGSAITIGAIVIYPALKYRWVPQAQS